MKAMAIGLSLLALSATAAFAQPSNSPWVSGSAGNSCLWSYQIDHTTVAPDTKSIVFHLRGGQQVVNTLSAPCNGLAFHGFVYVSRGDSVCAGQGIRVIQSGQVCMLGKFGPVTSQPGSAPASHT